MPNPQKDLQLKTIHLVPRPAIFILFCSLVIASCAKEKSGSSGTAAVVTTTPTKVTNTAIPSPVKEKPADSTDDGFVAGNACDIPPTKNVTLDLSDHSLRNSSMKNGQLTGEWHPTSHMCGYLKGEDGSRRPELALLIGNQGGLDVFKQHIGFLVGNWIAAAAGSHRRGCIYVLSKENIEKLASKENVERIVILGHGNDGDLVEAIGEKTVSPRDISTFRTKNLKNVNFFSCQAGKKRQDWERIFSRSKQVRLEMSSDNIAVTSALEELGQLMEDTWACKI